MSDLTLDIGGFRVRMAPFAHDHRYLTYPWKLDAFRVDADTYDFMYDREPQECSCGSLIHTRRNGFFRTDLYRQPDGSLLWCEQDDGKQEILRYHVAADFSRWSLLRDETQTNGRYAFEYLHQIFSCAVIPRGGLVLHGALIEWNGRGFVVCAPSGTGKTTHARLWRDTQRALIVNGDRALCRCIDGVWTAGGMPWCGTSGECVNRRVPLSALVVLTRGAENEAHAIPPLEAFQRMYLDIVAPQWDTGLLGQALDRFDRLMAAVPVVHLSCRPDTDAVDTLRRELMRIWQTQ